MKVYLLICDLDADDEWGSEATPYLTKEAAQLAMREEYDTALLDWEVDPEDLNDEQECECGEDRAVIRDDCESVTWRIEEHELDVQVAIRVRGGLVQAVGASADVKVKVFDLDVSDFPDKGEQEDADRREEELNALVSSPGWRWVW